MNDRYMEFLKQKMALASRDGFDIDPSEVHPLLKPHQRDIVCWAVRGGRRALFESFGLGKTLQQIEIVRLVMEKSGSPYGLIVCPLGVRQEFRRDAWMVHQHVAFIKDDDHIAQDSGIYLTNYESVREGKIDIGRFGVVSLDEAAILRGFGGTKTFRELMRLFEGTSTYRFVATATPSPNEYIELLSYAAFLGIMDVGQAKTRFFKRDSTHADRLTLHPHKEREFWLWVASWAIFLQKPSDLGYSDEGYELPPLDVRWHEIPSDHANAGAERDGQGRLLRDTAISIQNAAREKRDSLPARTEKLMQLRAEDPEAHRIIWHDLEAERAAIEEALPSIRYEYWGEFKDGNPSCLALYERHYSSRKYADGRDRKLFCGPGQKTVLLTEQKDALFVWRKFIDDAGQTGVNCAVFRNEGQVLSSDLIKEAMAIGWLRWPGTRFYTYVDPEEIESTNPGFCFLMAGWTKAGTTKNGKIILEALPGCVDVPSIAPHPAAVSVYGSQDLDEREQCIIDFSEGKIQELAAKPVIAGSGCNFQRHCSWAIFLGIGFKFADFIQAIHRIHRFLQTRQVRIDLIYTEAEREVRKQLERKWEQHNVMVAEMGKIIREYGLATEAMASVLQRSVGIDRRVASGQDWMLANNDCVLETAAMDSNSVGLVITSIPFSTQYEYSPSYNDFGHNENNAAFWVQMDFLTSELYRVIQPGRICAIHVKDRITPMGLTGLGFQTAQPFHAEAIFHYTRHGFGYLGMKTIVTDVVRENNQTYRLGWTEQCKDGTKMGCGMPEYLLLFRKPATDRTNGYADVPVVKEKPLSDDHGEPRPFDSRTNWKQPVPATGYSRAKWQFDAHGFSRSSGDRLLSSEELATLPHEKIFKLWRDRSTNRVYDFNEHVAIAEELDHLQRLPATFMLLPPHSWHPDVWADIARMRTLNMTQAMKGREFHLCPLQFDIVDRSILQFSNAGDLVYDPFAGLGTVPYCAIKLKRRAVGCELSPSILFRRFHFLFEGCRVPGVDTDAVRSGDGSGGFRRMKRLKKLFRQLRRALWLRPVEKPKRICATCQKPIRKRHKYFFDGGKVQHRDCNMPTGQPVEVRQQELIP